MNDLAKLFAGILLAVLVAACSERPGSEPEAAAPAQPAETAEDFIARVNAELKALSREREAAGWVRATYITEDTAILEAAAEERYAAWHGRVVEEASRYDDQELAPETQRALNIIKLGTSLPTPSDADKRKELVRIATDLNGMYGALKYCRDNGDCFGISELEGLMTSARDYDELLEYWEGWRDVVRPMRPMYERFVELANEGAREMNYADVGAMWRSGYDMGADEFRAETDRLWNQVKPLYDELHCHARAKLGEFYGEDKVPQDQPIPAHLLGNMWAQGWSFLYDIMEPYPGALNLDVDGTLETKDYSPREMVRSAENFYVSLGMPRLPETFWERSQFSKPADRDVVCHASAWGIDGGKDLRIKMCIKQTYDELRVIYHELGHNYYQGAYQDQPPIYQSGAHDGFHEAIGDTVVLSMTPDYLAEIGLIESAEQSREAVINVQMQQALDRIAFLPFAKLVDEWRWAVFSGEISPANYNQGWWDLRTSYQGISPPVDRGEDNFDPGGKYHIPGNTPYARYFLAHVLMYQFHKALCDAAGYEGELHACSVYGSKEAGEKFWAMLEAGQSEPWQNTLEKLTGTREMDGSAIIDYFQPLMAYLKEQNEGRSCGW